MNKKKIVVIGGGTGTFTVLTGLKKYPLELSAIVSMADDGGSTGMLRDELGVLPPGDVRQCLVALSASDRLMRELMNYRFTAGSLKGHSFGNLLLSALEKTTGSFDKAVEKVSEILRIEGHVIPATLDKVRLVAYVNGMNIKGQSAINRTSLVNLTRITLEPAARVNPKVREAIRTAHAIVIGPGDFYQSVVPNLLVHGIPDAIRQSRARIIFVCNLMTKAGHTDGWSVETFTKCIERYLGRPVDYVLYNSKHPDPKLIARYAREGEQPIHADRGLSRSKFIGADFVSKKFPKCLHADLLKRNFIRHNPDRLAKFIMKILS